MCIRDSFTATCSRVILGGMTLAAPGATGFVALAQRAVIEHVRSCFSTVCCPDYRTFYGNGPGQHGYACSDVPQDPPGQDSHSRPLYGTGSGPSTDEAQHGLQREARLVGSCLLY